MNSPEKHGKFSRISPHVNGAHMEAGVGKRMADGRLAELAEEAEQYPPDDTFVELVREIQRTRTEEARLREALCAVALCANCPPCASYARRTVDGAGGEA